MVTLDWGNGRTYATLANAIAAVPASLGDHYDLPGYRSAGGSLVHTITAAITPVITATNGYTFTIRGTEGSIRAGGQIVLNNTTNNAHGIALTSISNLQRGIRIENLEITCTGSSSFGISCGTTAFYTQLNEIYCHNCGYGAYYIGNGATAQACIFVSDLGGVNGVGAQTNSQCSLYDCLLISTGGPGLRQQGTEVALSSVTSIGATYGLQANFRAIIDKCIFYGGTYAIDAVTAENCAKTRRTIFWSGASATDIISGSSFATWAGNYAELFENNFVMFADPKLTLTGSYYNYGILQSNSPALASNNVAVTNKIYDGKYYAPYDVGAYTDYQTPDFPAVGNVLTRDTVDGVTGTYVPADYTKYATGETFGTDGTEFTGTADVYQQPPPLDAPYVAGGDDVYFIVRRTINGEVRRFIERMAPRFVDGAVEPENAFFLDCGATYDGAPATTISGLTHLEGEEVVVLADGLVVRGLTVASGSITLPNAASLVHVGLGYTSDLETLDLEFRASNSPTIHNQKRGAKMATVKVRNTSAMKIGPDTDSLETQIFEADEDSVDPIALFTGDKKIPIKSGNHGEAVVFIRNDDPLPIDVQSIIATLEVGDV